MKNLINRSEFFGFLFIVITGTLLHFVFDWSGGYKPLALIAAVNESVWEHLKLGFWPAFFFALFEFFWLRHENLPENFWAAKAVSLLIIPITIIVLFYGYTAILGDNALAIDISIFVLAIALAQAVSARIMKMAPFPPGIQNFSKLLIVVLVIAFSTLTYHPLQLPLFMDPNSKGFGIPI